MITISSCPQGLFANVRTTSLTETRLQRKRWTVTVDVQNTGDVYGCEIPQLYLAYPETAGEPPKVFRDFAR